jgi:hypothetical protein
MTDLLVLVPSRGRPDSVRELADVFEKTKTGDTDLLFCFDDDDETTYGLHREVCYDVGPRLRLCGTLNKVATELAPDYRYIGFMGDDHRPRTHGWDAAIISALDDLGTGIVYGDDLFQGENLPTAVFMTSNIIQTLGYMAPPVLTHMYLDDAWKAWGEGMGRIGFLSGVIIEHMHPHAGGKSEVDGGYADVWPYLEHDRPLWEAYRDATLATDVARLRELL